MPGHLPLHGIAAKLEQTNVFEPIGFRQRGHESAKVRGNGGQDRHTMCGEKARQAIQSSAPDIVERQLGPTEQGAEDRP